MYDSLETISWPCHIESYIWNTAEGVNYKQLLLIMPALTSLLKDKGKTESKKTRGKPSREMGILQKPRGV